jgi:hypothetical protein
MTETHATPSLRTRVVCALTYVLRKTNRSKNLKPKVPNDKRPLVRKVWNGRSNLEEFEANGSAGHIEGLTLRPYNPNSR